MSTLSVSGKSRWITRLIAFVCFLVVPVLVTGMVPVTWVTLTRVDGEVRPVSAVARTCTLIVVPYRTTHLADITEVEQNIDYGDLIHRRYGDRNYQSSRRSEDKGQLILLSRDGDVRVAVTPASLDRVVDDVADFLKGEGGPRRRIFMIANWKFGLGFGGPATLLALLYVVGCMISMLHLIMRAMTGKGGKTGQ